MPGLVAENEVFIQRGGFVSQESGALDTASENVIRIPLRLRPGQPIPFEREDIILNDGDIVFVRAREFEIYYTGGLLNNGQFLLPRDTDLDVIEAVSIAGRIPSTNRSPAEPTELIVLRRLPGQPQISIRVDLARALSNPRERILVAPGDMLILRYKPAERIFNFGDSVFRTYGIGQLGR